MEKKERNNLENKKEKQFETLEIDDRELQQIYVNEFNIINLPDKDFRIITGHYVPTQLYKISQTSSNVSYKFKVGLELIMTHKTAEALFKALEKQLGKKDKPKNKGK